MSISLIRRSAIGLAVAAAILSTSSAHAEEPYDELLVRVPDASIAVVSQLAETFTAQTGTPVTVERGDPSDSAVNDLVAGVDIAVLSRPVTEAEESAAVVGARYGFDALLVVVDAQNTSQDFSIDQMKSLFSDAHASAGSETTFTPFAQPTPAPAWQYFTRQILEGAEATANTPTDQTLSQRIAGDPTAVGLTRATDANETSNTRIATVQGAAPSTENVRSGAYPLATPLVLATFGEPYGGSQAFIEFVLSAEGQDIVQGFGYTSAQDESEVRTASVETDEQP